MAKKLPLRALSLITLAVVGALAAFIVYVPSITSQEVGRVSSPDGTVDAVLLEVPRDAAGMRSYKVCLRRPNGLPTAAAACKEIVYLAGVSTSDVSQPVKLVWTAPRQLEVRYATATSVHIYKPVFTWRTCWLGPCGSYASNLPILISAVQTNNSTANKSDGGH